MDAKSQLTALLALRLLGCRWHPWIDWAAKHFSGTRIASAKTALNRGETMASVLRRTGLFDGSVIALIDASTGGEVPDAAIEYLTRIRFAVSAPELYQKPVYLAPAALIEDVLFHALEVEEADKRVMYDRILVEKTNRK